MALADLTVSDTGLGTQGWVGRTWSTERGHVPWCTTSVSDATVVAGLLVLLLVSGPSWLPLARRGRR